MVLDLLMLSARLCRNKSRALPEPCRRILATLYRWWIKNTNTWCSYTKETRLQTCCFIVCLMYTLGVWCYDYFLCAGEFKSTTLKWWKRGNGFANTSKWSIWLIFFISLPTYSSKTIHESRTHGCKAQFNSSYCKIRPLLYKPEPDKLIIGCCERESIASKNTVKNHSTNPHKNSLTASKEITFEFWKIKSIV